MDAKTTSEASETEWGASKKGHTVLRDPIGYCDVPFAKKPLLSLTR